MNFRNYLKEEYFSRIGGTEIFVNPSWSEISKIDEVEQRGVRFIADPKKKKIYVWPAYEAIHLTVFEKAMKKNWTDKFNYFMGEAKKRGDQLIVFASDSLEYAPEKYSWIANINWSWTKRYNIDVDTYLKKWKKKLEKF